LWLHRVSLAALTRAKHRGDEVVDARRDEVSHASLLAEGADGSVLAFVYLLLIEWLLALLHAENSVVEGVLCGAALLLIENDGVGELLPHLFHFLLPLLLFGLLRHLEEVRVENLVRVQSVRVRVVFFVVRLVHLLQLVVPLGYARD